MILGRKLFGVETQNHVTLLQVMMELTYVLMGKVPHWRDLIEKLLRAVTPIIVPLSML